MLAVGEEQLLFQQGSPDERARARSNFEYRDGIGLVWRPYFGVEAGHTLDQPAIAKEARGYFRAECRVKGQVNIYWVRNALRLNGFDLFGEDHIFYLPDPGHAEDFHNFLATGIEASLTKNLSIIFTYKVGEDSPKFTKIESWNLGVGLKF